MGGEGNTVVTWACWGLYGCPVAFHSCCALCSLWELLYATERGLKFSMRIHALTVCPGTVTGFGVVLAVKVSHSANSHMIPSHYFAKDYLQSKIQVANLDSKFLTSTQTTCGKNFFFFLVNNTFVTKTSQTSSWDILTPDAGKNTSRFVNDYFLT